MDKHLISDDDLNEYLLSCVSLSIERSDYLAHVFAFQYSIGCRGEELCRNDTLDINFGTGKIGYTQPKTGTTRSLFLPSFTPFVIEDFIGVKECYDTFVPSTLRRYWLRFMQGQRLYVGEKNCNLHIFRHNYARQLREEGLSNNDIMANMGLTSLSTVAIYTSSPIYISE